MRFSSPLLPVLGALAFQMAPVKAEDASTAQELRELRQVVQQQSRQIELLAEQVGRLTRALNVQKAEEFAPPATSSEAPKPAAEGEFTAPRAEEIPKGEAVPGGMRHIVVKGETLTSIAKQYNISIAELKNTNKIENERKLQIGQVLMVPAPKTPESTDKKDNP